MKKSLSARHSHSKALSAKGKTIATNQVRIIGGQFKRRNVNFIDSDGLRPTPDRLRETLFNWLLADIHDACVLDTCAGSGVLGFEALSRGAKHCTFIEANALQAQILSQSAEQLKLDTESYQVLTAQAEQLLTADNQFKQPFDIIFIDPPYALDLWRPILQALLVNKLINSESLLYLEADKDLSADLDKLANSLNQTDNSEQTSTAKAHISFNSLKQTKVGQVVAGLYQLSSS